MLLCAACAPTTYSKPDTSQSQRERDLEACNLEGAARATEALPRAEDYRVDSAFESGPYELETRMRFAAQDAAESEYREYLDEQIRAYLTPCMQRKGYRSGLLESGQFQAGQQHHSQYQGRNHV